MDTRQNPYNEPSCSDGTVPETDSPRKADVGRNGSQRTYSSRKMLKGAAGHAETSADDVIADVLRETEMRQNRGRDDISAILDEVEQKRHSREHSEPDVAYSSPKQEAPAVRRSPREEARRPQTERMPKAAASPTGRRTPVTHTAAQAKAASDAKQPQKNENGKKKQKHYSFVDSMKFFIPWKGDSAFEAMRKVVFSTAVVVVGVCTFLISNYYIDRYKAKKMYAEIQAEIEDVRANRHFNAEIKEDPETGEMFEWLEYNDYAKRLLPINPDMVGYISVPGTEVSYPVVQKKSSDPSVDTNDYYLYRTFKQESSKSGCIFMDYRNRFDEVVDHRRIVDNSGNVFIYGHNMNNRTMFGSLRDYINNPSFYSAHPIVEYSSLYKDYKFKIFALFIVDGEDLTSEYAFDCWNTLNFEDEDAFYDYVNEAKKRTMINTDVDVKYGDQLLSLYTCNGLVANAKLILMCREVRAGEDLYEGTENATLNDNVLYPGAYYKYGRPVNYDPKKFVPYGPET